MELDAVKGGNGDPEPIKDNIMNAISDAESAALSDSDLPSSEGGVPDMSGQVEIVEDSTVGQNFTTKSAQSVSEMMYDQRHNTSFRELASLSLTANIGEGFRASKAPVSKFLDVSVTVHEGMSSPGLIRGSAEKYGLRSPLMKSDKSGQKEVSKENRRILHKHAKDNGVILMGRGAYNDAIGKFKAMRGSLSDTKGYSVGSSSVDELNKKLGGVEKAIKNGPEIADGATTLSVRATEKLKQGDNRVIEKVAKMLDPPKMM